MNPHIQFYKQFEKVCRWVYSGMRIGELEIVEINLQEGYFKGGIKTKAGKERIIPIHNCILTFVREFDQKNFHAGTFRDNKFYKLIQSIGMPPLTNGKSILCTTAGTPSHGSAISTAWMICLNI